MEYYMRKILIVEDNLEIGQFIVSVLMKEGFQSITLASTYQEAIEKIDQEVFDVAILDIMLPDGNGFDILAYIREFSFIPVLFLSAVSDIEKQYKGFELGADDYVLKPFASRDLILRVKSLLKRAYPQEQAVLALSSATIDFERAVIHKDGKDLPLTAKEYAILRVLADNLNRIVTFDSLMARVWGQAYDGYNNTLMAHIRKIRQKIERNPSQPDHLLTVKGLGYKLEGLDS